MDPYYQFANLCLLRHASSEAQILPPTDTPILQSTNSTPTTEQPTSTNTDPAEIEQPVEESSSSEPALVIAGESNVNIRSGPGTDYDIVGKLPAGQSLEIVGRNADSSWWQVSTPNSLGWVAAEVTTASNVDDNIPIAEAPLPLLKKHHHRPFKIQQLLDFKKLKS